MIVRGQATIAGLNLGVDTTVKEGNEFARTISLGTPSDGWTVTADYGQGAQPVELSASGFFTLRLVPDDNGSKTITVAANHTSGMSLSDSLVLTIQNVAPTAAITGPTFILAGQSAAVDLSATDPSSADTTGGFSYSIDWKDGSAVQTIAAGDPSTNLTHLYGTPGTYAIEVKATDKDGMTSTAKTLGMTVLAETLSLGAAVRMNEGGTMSRAESLGIVGDGWTVTADYGDGPQDLTVNSNGTFTLSHAYPDNGNNTIAVVATHAASGTMRNGTLSVVVGNAVPTATASGATWGLMGQNLSLKLAASDPSPTDKTAGFSYSINWKDGSAVQAVATGVSSVSHAFADAGTYKVEIRATDKEGATGPVQTYTVTILPVALEADPADATKTSLRVMGTDEADTIRLLWAKDNRVKVVLNDTTLGAFKPTGSVRVFGRGGNDVISVASGLTIRAELHGGHGNDTLVGGSGNDILLGEAGGDVLTGMAGRDLLIGGPAADKLDGGAGDDILIAGTTNYDVAPVSLGKLMAEWTNSAVTYAKRVTHLTGGRGGYNGKLWLTRQSVFSDSRIDALTSGAGSDLFFYTKGEDAAKDLAAPEYGLAG
jgi:hypothetical protein